jgi:hypothetical protein
MGAEYNSFLGSTSQAFSRNLALLLMRMGKDFVKKCPDGEAIPEQVKTQHND